MDSKEIDALEAAQLRAHVALTEMRAANELAKEWNQAHKASKDKAERDDLFVMFREATDRWEAAHETYQEANQLILKSRRTPPA